jgi:hypothetical protein
MVFIPFTSRVCGNRSSRSELAAFVALLAAPSLLLLCSLLSLSSLVFRRGGLEFCFLSRPLLERLGEIWFWVGFFFGEGGSFGVLLLGVD